MILVGEEEIYRAMQTLYYEDRLVVEGAGAVPVAALQAGRLPAIEGPVAAIVSGRNVDMEMFTGIVTGQRVQLGEIGVGGFAYGA